MQETMKDTMRMEGKMNEKADARTCAMCESNAQVLQTAHAGREVRGKYMLAGAAPERVSARRITLGELPLRRGRSARAGCEVHGK